MLVTSTESELGKSNRTPSILDSPILARVERAHMRLEANNNGYRRDDSLVRSILDPRLSIMNDRTGCEANGFIKRGVLWQQRDRLFSRWKERYFLLTLDYLHCFKRASGTATEKISNMGQFLYKIKLIDIERVEWQNRRTYSVVSLLIGREGRILLRCDHGLEDWHEMLEECTMQSKERRRILLAAQAPRTRASLAAPPSHSPMYANQLLGNGINVNGGNGSVANALREWFLAKQQLNTNTMNNFPLSDSVPDLTATKENCDVLSNHSTPNRISSNLNSRYNHHNHHHPIHQQQSQQQHHHHQQQQQQQQLQQQQQHQLHQSQNGSSSSFHLHQQHVQQLNQKNHLLRINGEVCSPYRRSSSRNSRYDCGNDEDCEVQLRHNRVVLDNSNNNDKADWMYRRPIAPNDHRHSFFADMDLTAYDSSIDTPPQSYRNSEVYYQGPGSRHSTAEMCLSSARSTLISLRDSFHRNNNGLNNLSINSPDKRRSVDNHHQQQIQSVNKNNINEIDSYDPNQNRCNVNKKPTNYLYAGNNNSVIREQFQHPVLTALINESQCQMRDRSYSDTQQNMRRSNGITTAGFSSNASSPKHQIIGKLTRV